MRCEKIPYTSKRNARFASRTMGNTFRCYWCDEHHAWHVTKERIGR